MPIIAEIMRLLLSLTAMIIGWLVECPYSVLAARTYVRLATCSDPFLATDASRCVSCCADSAAVGDCDWDGRAGTVWRFDAMMGLEVWATRMVSIAGRSDRF